MFKRKMLAVLLSTFTFFFLFACDILPHSNANNVTNEGELEEAQEEIFENGIPIDAEHFPDDTFRGYLSKLFDTDKDGFFSNEEIENITELYVYGYDITYTHDYYVTGIKNISGIEYFTALVIFKCEYQEISEVDISKNVNLERISFRGCDLIETIDISNNPKLIEATKVHEKQGFYHQSVSDSEEFSRFVTNYYDKTEKGYYDVYITYNENVTLITGEETETAEEEIETIILDYDYSSVINLYSEYMCDPQSMDYAEAGISSGVMEEVLWGDAEEAYKRVGYTLMDISGDGNPELIIAVDDEYDGLRVLAIYGMNTDGPVMVVQGASRARVYLLEDNRIYNEGSGGAAYFMCGTRKLNLAGTELEVIENFYTDTSDPNNPKLYENKTGKYTYNDAELIDYDTDYMAILDINNTKVKELTLTAFVR